MPCEVNVVELRADVSVPTTDKIRIALADDHPIFRDGLCRLLSLEEDFVVVAQVNDGLQALEVLRQYEPDILLLDLSMPGLNGLATLQRVQAAKTKTRVILLTASDNQNEFVDALKLGSCGIVQKQTATDLLVDSIRRVHAGELWMDSRTTAAVIQRFVSPGDLPSPASAAAHQYQDRSPLSPREREIVNLTAQGFKNSDMAAKLSLSEQTIKNHLHNIFEKLGVSDRLELALHAVEHRLVGVSEPAKC
jgi:two-component system, NarL family, nitrate/nitrite response regulator NarL